jgi:hypothetical protein
MVKTILKKGVIIFSIYVIITLSMVMVGDRVQELDHNKDNNTNGAVTIKFFK